MLRLLASDPLCCENLLRGLGIDARQFWRRLAQAEAATDCDCTRASGALEVFRSKEMLLSPTSHIRIHRRVVIWSILSAASVAMDSLSSTQRRDAAAAWLLLLRRARKGSIPHAKS